VFVRRLPAVPEQPAGVGALTRGAAKASPRPLRGSP